jgi:hypothetical protein
MIMMRMGFMIREGAKGSRGVKDGKRMMERQNTTLGIPKV